MSPPDAGPDPLTWLLEASHHLPPADFTRAVGHALRRSGARRSCLYVADHDHLTLVPLAEGPGTPPPAPIDDSTGGRAYALEVTTTEKAGEGTRVWVPLVDGTARLGVLSADLDPGADDEPTIRVIEQVASLVAELMVAKSQYSDVFERARRRRHMSLEAELQRGTLPPVTLVTPQVTVAGLLLPAYEVAGDSFDYALGPDRLDVAIIDSVGHDIRSSVISHLVQGSLRNSRRGGMALAESYRAADDALRSVFPDVYFATAAFGHLHLHTGRFRWVSAGHPPPLTVRGGTVSEAPTTPVLPVGLGGVDPAVNEIDLEPGDLVVLYTDGMTEGGVPGGEPFGLERLVELLGHHLRSSLPPAETLRRLVHAVLTHSEDRLRDDTSLLLVQYHGPPDHRGITA